ncbi:cation:proton antiporter [candidate division KSB1 bacterium]|nr:cation:proton antiporter [candidate division KSB1 bacterium]
MMNVLFLAGICIFLGTFGGEGIKRIKAPQVVGYILIGVLLGSSGFNLVKLHDVEGMDVIVSFTLGLIGFGIGRELKVSQLRSLGKSILSIVVFEAFGAFLLVAIGVTILTKSIATGLIFGALASATAPAATVDVLYEYKSKGPLTTTLLAVVGIDDAVALILYGFASSVAKSFLSETAAISALDIILKPLMEIGGSIALGLVFGAAYAFLVKKQNNPIKILSITISIVLLLCGLSKMLGLSLILSNMTMGILIANIAPVSNRKVATVLDSFSPPFYIFFFTLVGARLQIGMLPQMGLIGIIYVIFRTAGKFSGTWFGAKISGATDSVRKYLGFALFSQAGVAVGLAISASHELAAMGQKGIELGQLAINVVTATTFIVQLIGPPFVKYAIIKANEAGKALDGLIE